MKKGYARTAAQIESIVIDGYHADVFAEAWVAGNAQAAELQIRVHIEPVWPDDREIQMRLL